MGKYNLGKSKSVVSEKVSKDRFYLDEKRTKILEDSIGRNLELISVSLTNIDRLLVKTLNTGEIKGSREKVFRSWARKCKSQANSALRLKEKLNESYEQDIKYSPIKELDAKIAELEAKLAVLEENEKR